MPAPDRDRATARLSNSDARSDKPSGTRSPHAPIAVRLRAPRASGADKSPSRRCRRTRRPEGLAARVRFGPQLAVLEQRRLLSALYASDLGDGDGNSHIYRIADYASTPAAVDIGASGTHLTDLAIDPLNDAAYGINGGTSELYAINLNTGKATEVGGLALPAWSP